MAKTSFEGHKLCFSSSTGYPTFWNGSKNVLVHRYIWEKYHGPIPEGYVIHHKDGNKSNFDITNLELMSHSKHNKLHAHESGFGKRNKGRPKLHQSGFCPKARKVIISNESECFIFNSISEASRFLSCDRDITGDICRVLSGNRKTVRGYKCEYA